MYSWTDQGRGGHYAIRDPDQGVDGGAGYWAYFVCPHRVHPGSGGTSTMSLPLGAYHASLIGNPSGTSSVTVSGFDFAARWNPSTRRYAFSAYRAPVRLGVGEAIWVISYVTTTVRITP